MEDNRLSYDSKTKTLSYDAATAEGELLPKQSGLDLSRIARAESYQGKDVEDVVVVFGDQETARLNADPLAFLGVGSKGPQGVAKSTAQFEKRADFELSED